MDVNTMELVKKYNFRFTKSLGQNFLVDSSVLRDIVEGSEVSKEDHVIEIGPGVGTLTKELLERAKRVTSIELDSSLIPILEAELGDREGFNLINKDALKVNFKELISEGEKVKVVANLPYYVTTPIIARLLNENIAFDSLTIMIQKEVAERINAVPGNKDYGALSLLVQYHCDTEIIRRVPPTAFMPRPKVDSIVIKLTKLPEPRVKVVDEKLFFAVIREAFNMRRKTLSNALKGLKLQKEDLEEAFRISGIDPKRRGETLSVEEFAELSNCIIKYMNYSI